MPIRWRLTLFIALTIGVILLVLAFALYFVSRHVLLQSLKDTVHERADFVAGLIEDGEPLNSAAAAKKADPKLLENGVALVVRNEKSGKILLTYNIPPRGKDHSGPVWREAARSKGEASDTGIELAADNPYYVHAKWADPPKGPPRVVVTGKTYEPGEDALEVFAIVIAVGFGAAFLLVIGGAYLLAGAALKPVDAVTGAARKMGEGDLSKRLPVANPRDELGRLVVTINGLLSRLEGAFARREEALERQRRFAADASHELRTPLTAISGHAKMLKEWALEEDPERAKRSVDVISREADRMRGLSESLLALARGDEGASPKIGHHDLVAVAEEAAQATRDANNGKVSVECSLPDGEVEATFDRDRALQAACILLDNAVRYTPEGGNVTVSVREEGERAALEVSDTGVGIPEDQLPLVFERFHRADPSRSKGGAGLGLSIARQIADSHGGELRAKSTPGAGSTFTLYFFRNGAPRLRHP